ncbi:MAG: DUF1931 domain-containing protein [Candidatus Micrarchaeota archaeon]
MQYIIKGAVKAYLKKGKFRVAGITYEALDRKIEEWLSEASERTKKNGRLTVMPQDL